MQTSGYRAWLEQRGLVKSSVGTYVSDAKRVEDHYGDLDELYSKDRLAGVLQELRYSADDARRNAPNPSKIPIDANPYKGLASYRSTVTRYREYREADMSSDDLVPETPDEDDGGRALSDSNATCRPRFDTPSNSWSQVWTSLMVAPNVPLPPASSTSLQRRRTALLL